MILYEAPHRLTRTLTDLEASLGTNRPLVIVRELTKLHEEVWRGTLAEARERAEATPPRGEHVLVVGGGTGPSPPSGADLDRALRERLEQGMSRRQAVAETAVALGLPRNRVYEAVLALDHPPPG
jgi:16S rRNA (cytidine1402-2'-O)-methyltransferase